MTKKVDLDQLMPTTNAGYARAYRLYIVVALVLGVGMTIYHFTVHGTPERVLSAAIMVSSGIMLAIATAGYLITMRAERRRRQHLDQVTGRADNHQPPR